LKLIINRVASGHVSLDTINEFEKSILSSNKSAKLVRRLNKYATYLLSLLYRFSLKLGIPISTYLVRLSRLLPKLNDNQVFAVMMGLEPKKCLFHFLFPFPIKSIYLFDAWPNTHDKIINFVNFFDVSHVFVSSSQAAEMLNTKIKRSNVFWIPEGINPYEYRFYTQENKDIDVLALGRRYDLYHDLIVDSLKDNGKVYLYENVKGKIIFPTREEFIEGLGRSKISICIPSCITHPERSGAIETMTIRYLQSMVSKCLVVGKAPAEMIQLFGYNPVIEIDFANPQDQILRILNSFNEYTPLIEKNYQTVIQHHTWNCRWIKIEEIIRNNPTD